MALSNWFNRRNRRRKAEQVERDRYYFLRKWRVPLSLERLEERVAPATLAYPFGSAAADPRAVTLRLSGADLQIVDAGTAAVLATQPLADTTDVSVTGAGGMADVFTIDFT